MHVDFHVEEPSAEEALRRLLPQIVRNRATYKIIDHRSKERLLRMLPQRLRAYADRVVREDLRIVVLVDRDDDDCLALKGRLEEVARLAGLRTKTVAGTGAFHVVNRVAVEELEAWFFGDVAAICATYPRVPASLAQKASFRNPDAIRGGTWEALHRILKKHGYLGEVYPKKKIAEEIASKMNPTLNRSHSFRCFVEGIEALF